MDCSIRKWSLTDAAELAANLSNKKVQDKTDVVQQTCEYVFAHSDILRIFAEPFSYNVASCRVLEKAGFQFEGVLRKNAIKNGKILDMKMYSLVR